MLKPTEPTSAEHSSAEVFVTGRKVSPGSGAAFSGDTARPERPASLSDALPEAPACDAVFAGFPLFSGGSPFPEGLVLPDDAQTAAPPSFADFALGVYPFLELEPFHRAYYRVLEAFAAGRVRRLIVTMPPQHGKSVGATTLLPAYVLGLDPDQRVAIASYSGTLASKFNRRVQRILESQEYAAFFRTPPSSAAPSHQATSARPTRSRSSAAGADCSPSAAKGR